MKVFSSIQSFKSNKETVVTLGTFDGVHVGHKFILNKLIQSANDLNCESLVLTFFPHPRMVLKQNDTIKLINTIEEKEILLAKIGIDNLVVHPFDDSFSQLSGEEFVKNILVDVFRAKKIIIGHDHRFGKGGSCDITDLIHFGLKYNFEVEQISAQEINEVSVSSTKVRNAIVEGNIEIATNFLGYNFFITGTVVKGKQLGRTIGFPTANIQPTKTYKLLPKEGVYIVEVIFNKVTYQGMMNIGKNPTVNGIEQTIEVNILNFDQDIYGEKVEVCILEFIRDVLKFNSLTELKNQLQKDKETTLLFFENKMTC